MRRGRMKRMVVLCVLAGWCGGLQAQGWECKVLRGIQEHRTPAMDGTMSFVSNTLVLAPVTPGMQLLMGTQMVDGTVGVTPEMQKRVALDGLQTLTALGLDMCVTTGLKYAVHRPRPYIQYADTLQPLRRVRGYSFPSGHSSLAFATAVSLSMEYPRWYVVAPTLLWATTVAYSRLYLGVHNPTDVLVGALVGSASAYVAHRLVEKRREELGLPEPKGIVVPLTIRF